MKTQLTVLSVLLTLPVFSQTSKKVATQSCVAYWKKGEKKSYSITHVKEKTNNGKVVSKSVLHYGAEITVTDSTEEEYTMEWKVREPASGKNEANEEVALTFLKGLTIVY